MHFDSVEVSTIIRSNILLLARCPFWLLQHRHPLIERLGFLFMMKLRLGPEFGRKGGAAWRLVFVCMLMPWLRKYRRNLGHTVQGMQRGHHSSSNAASALALKSLLKDALVDNLLALEERYKAMAESLQRMNPSSATNLSGLVASVGGSSKKETTALDPDNDEKVGSVSFE